MVELIDVKTRDKPKKIPGTPFEEFPKQQEIPKEPFQMDIDLPSSFSEISEEQLRGIFKQENDSIREAFEEGIPQGFQPLDPEIERALELQGIDTTPPEESTLTQQLVSRFFGTDVNDPLVLERAGTVAVGAIGGGFLGSRVPPVGPFGPLITATTTLGGSAIGTFLGAVAPELTIEIAESFGLIPEGTRLKEGLSGSQFKTVIEGEVMLDIATGGGLLAARRGGIFLSEIFTGLNKEGRAIAESGAKFDIHLMPIQLGDRVIARGFVSVLGRFPLIGGKLRKFGQRADDAARSFFSGLPDRIGPVRAFSDISDTIYNDAREMMRLFNKNMGQRYEELFRRAEDLGVSVIPKSISIKGVEILEEIAKQTPPQIGGKGTPGPILEPIQKFIRENVLDLKKMSLQQLDGFISKIDQQIAKLDPAEQKIAIRFYTQLRQAAQLDSVQHLVGKNASSIKGEMQALDREFSTTMSEVFETATANKFASVQRKGLKSVDVDKATRIPIDQLSKMIVKLDSPQAINELSRLIRPETFKDVVVKVLDDAVEDSFKRVGGSRQFDVEAFSKRLGLDRPNSNKFNAVKEMLETIQSPITMKDLQGVVEVTRKISSLEIPDVSTFIARRGTIGGLQSIISGVIPGLALLGGASAAGHYSGSGLMGMAFFLGGGRLISAILANPNTARQLKSILSESITIKGAVGFPLTRQPAKEAEMFLRRKKWTNIIKGGLQAMLSEGTISEEEHNILGDIYDKSLHELDKEVSDLIDSTKLLIQSKSVDLEKKLTTENGKIRERNTRHDDLEIEIEEE